MVSWSASFWRLDRPLSLKTWSGPALKNISGCTWSMIWKTTAFMTWFVYKNISLPFESSQARFSAFRDDLLANLETNCLQIFTLRLFGLRNEFIEQIGLDFFYKMSALMSQKGFHVFWKGLLVWQFVPQDFMNTTCGKQSNY